MENTIKCFRCSKGKMYPGRTKMEATLNGKFFEIECEAMVCNKCELKVLDPKQTDEYLTASADMYESIYGGFGLNCSVPHHDR